VPSGLSASASSREDSLRMHELQVTERILDVVLKHAAGHDVSRIVVIHLKVGELSDLEDEWLQRYFDYLSKDTLAENARLAIERAPIVMQCESCSASLEVRKDELREIVCAECGGSRFRLVSGREYLVKNIEVV
jgi:hydrogenase nickel incorporation protein HypA/HybF